MHSGNTQKQFVWTAAEQVHDADVDRFVTRSHICGLRLITRARGRPPETS